MGAGGGDNGARGVSPLRGPRWVVATALALTVAAYAASLGNPFVYDDVLLVPTNALLRSGAGLRTFFAQARLTSSPIWPHHYRPILMLTFWLDYRLGGVAPTVYRATNLAIHLGNGLLAFRLLRRVLRRWYPAATSDWASAFGAALFLLHPIQAIAIELVLKRNSSLSTLFMLAALLLYARSGAATRARALAYAAALGCGLLALLSKEDALVLPALIALYGLATGTGGIAPALPFALAPALFLLRVVPAEAVVHGPGSALGHLLAQPVALGRYARMLLDPDAIAIAYDLEPRLQPLPWARLAALLALATALGLLVRARRRWPLAAFAAAWAALLLAPSSSLFPIALTMDEVRCYLALLFCYGLCGVGLTRLMAFVDARAAGLRSRRFLALSPWLLACVLMLGADWRSGHDWGDALALYQHAVARYPDGRLGNRGLCEQQLAAADPAAVAQCRRAVALWPDDPMARYFLVGALARAGDAEATAVARAAVAQFPGSSVAWTALGHLAWLHDDHRAAAAAYRRALALDPLDDGVRVHLADTLAALGDTDGARRLVASFADAPPGRADDAQLLQAVAARLR